MSNGVQFYDDAETVLFWDGRMRTRAELDAVLPGLFEYSRTHPRLAEITPYNLSKEVMYWGATSVLVLGVGIGMLIWKGADLGYLILLVPYLGLGVSSRIIFGALQSRLVTVAHNGSFEVYRHGKIRQGPIWSTNLCDIDWRLGRGRHADSRRECLLEAQYRKVVLIRRRHRSLFKKDELYGCGWTPEMKVRWLALFLVCSTDGSEQTAEFEAVSESTRTGIRRTDPSRIAGRMT